MLDINLKKLKKNAFRYTKVRGMTALRVRVPGGHLDVSHLTLLQEIAEKFGNGTLHITTRQGFEIPGIKIEDIEAVNATLQPLIEATGINQAPARPREGYPAAGTRNVTACIGNRVCPFANGDTTALALAIEKQVFPNDFHVKIAVTGCPNDCLKVLMHDVGIMMMSEPVYDPNRCISCNACVKNCKLRVTGALKMENFRIVRDECRCIGCGECVLKCPTRAWTRAPEKYFRVTLFGRTGKKNPRLGEDFLVWADEATVLAVIRNLYAFIDAHIDRTHPDGKEHVGYIADRTGYQVLKHCLLKGIKLNPKTVVRDTINWDGIRYAVDNA
jgi:anaerobic sulfite reductase subunit C